VSTGTRDDEIDALRGRIAALEAELAGVQEAKRELARVDALRREIVAGAPIGLGIADELGEFLLWNDAMLAVSGFAPSQVAEWQRHRATEAAQRSRGALLEVVRERGGLFGHEVPIPRPDGTAGIAVATVKPVEVDGERLLHVTMQDVTELKRVEGALRESELRFRQVAETLRHVFYITTHDHRQVLYVSPAYEALWGRSCESLYAEARAWIDAIHEDDRPRVFEQVERGSVDGAYVLEYRIVRPDGSTRWILDRAYELPDANGDAYRVVGVAEDITERRRLEAQLRESQKMEAVGQLAGGVAHDFNNLLTIVLANVTLLADGTAPGAPQRALLDEVVRAASRARELTRKLLGFSRRAALELRPWDLRATVRETVALLRRTLDPRIRVVVDEPAELGLVLADPGEMSQVLLNLCLNARDAMPEGGTLVVRTGSHTISEAHVRDHLDARMGEAIRLTVEDSGRGIAPETRGRIFEPFFTTKEPGTGTGLGLAMVFGIVTQHRGWIELDSELGRGTRVDVYLPLHGGVPTNAASTEDRAPRARAAETILFVDDEEGIRTVAAAILAERGYQVLLAEDGVAALALFEQKWRSIDLVVLDLRMPRLSGRDTLHAIWRIDPNARVVITSGHSDDYQRVAEAEPVAGCLRKPWRLDELARAIQTALATGSDD
jgi:PAS domain S-box-containing protein